MSNHWTAIVGLVLAVIAIVVTVTNEEIRKYLGLDKKSDCEMAEEEVLASINQLEKTYLSFSPTNSSYPNLVMFCDSIVSLSKSIELNKGCLGNKVWQNEFVDFVSLSHRRIVEITMEWDKKLKDRDNKETAEDLFYKAAVLMLTISSKKLCETNEAYCDKFNRAFANILSKYEQEKFIVDHY